MLQEEGAFTLGLLRPASSRSLPLTAALLGFSHDVMTTHHSSRRHGKPLLKYTDITWRAGAVVEMVTHPSPSPPYENVGSPDASPWIGLSHLP